MNCFMMMSVVTDIWGLFLAEEKEGKRMKQATGEKLMLAAIDLMAEKGYNGVTTEEIAKAAGLSEKTLFRHFGSKQNLLISAFDRYHYGEEMKSLFADEFIGELQHDLLLFSQAYHRIMNRNRKLIQIAMKEDGNMPELRERAHKHPQQLKQLLTDYFNEMIKHGKAAAVNPETTAVSFMLLNFGMFQHHVDEKRTRFSGVTIGDLIQDSVNLFVRALSP